MYGNKVAYILTVKNSVIDVSQPAPKGQQNLCVVVDRTAVVG
jgi:hypothetical protein